MLVVLAAFLLCTVALSLYLSLKLLPEWQDRRQYLFPGALLVSCLPLFDFGQREHFTFVATVPYVLLVAKRRHGETVSTGLAVAIGVLAAVGFALKPHFVLVPIALELWLQSRPLRPETVTLVIAALVYAVAFVVIEPDYFTLLPLITETYSAFGKPTPLLILPGAGLFVFGACLLLRARGTSAALLVAALSFYLAFLLQAKGFNYQQGPAIRFLLLATAAFPLHTLVQKTLAAAIALVAIVPTAIPYQDNSDLFRLPPGASFAALATSPRLAWPEAEYRRWPIRAMSPWMASGLKDKSPVSAMLEHDLACNPPDYLLVYDGGVIEYTPMIPEALKAYTPAKTDVENGPWSHFLKRVRDLPRPAHCRTIY